MKTFKLILALFLIPIISFAGSADNPARTGNLGGFQATDDTLCSPTIVGFGSPTNVKILCSRMGDKLRMHGSFTSGVTTGTPGKITLPAGYVIDSNKLSSLSERVGFYHNLLGAVSSIFPSGYGLVTFYDGSDTGSVYIAYQLTANTFIKNNADVYASNGVTQSFDFIVPISGWSSNGSSPARTVSVHHVSDWSAASGWGSTDTAVVKMSGSAVVQQNTGSGITYANTSTDGATWTVATGHGGICSMHGSIQGANAYNIGAVITKNADATTQATNVDSLGSAHAAYVVAHAVVTGSAARGTSAHVSWRGPCTANDVFRLQGINGVTRDMSTVYFELEE